MSFKIVDCAGNIGRYATAYKANGGEAVIRYLSANTNPARSKNIFAPEAHAIKAAGIKLGLVWETSGGTKHELNSALGVADAKRAIAQAKVVGAPEGACIYFACDTNPTGAFYNQVMAYFASVRATMNAADANSKYRVGIYGPGKMCAAALDAGHVDLAWLANAHGWSGYKEFLASKRWVLHQFLPQHVPGISFSVDPNELAPGKSYADAGFFVPFEDQATTTEDADEDEPAAPHDLGWVQQTLSDNGIDAGPADGVWGAKTEAAVIKAVEELKATVWPDQA